MVCENKRPSISTGDLTLTSFTSFWHGSAVHGITFNLYKSENLLTAYFPNLFHLSQYAMKEKMKCEKMSQKERDLSFSVISFLPSFPLSLPFLSFLLSRFSSPKCLSTKQSFRNLDLQCFTRHLTTKNCRANLP